MSKRVTIFGTGAWGTAIAQLFAGNGHHVMLWTREPAIAEEINTQHTNKKYVTVALHENIRATTNLAQALEQPDWLVEAVPVVFLRSVLTLIAQCKGTQTTPWLLLSKGIEQQTNLLPSAILDDVFGYPVPKVILAGPSFAKELVVGAFTATMLAGDDASLVQQAQQLVQSDYFKTYATTDVAGVQVGGAVKNVVALAAGFAHGCGGGENMHAFLLTQGFAELAQLITLYGGQNATSTSLAGLGDLLLTASSTTSKNFRAGVLLSQGATLVGVEEALGTLPEGINTTQSLHELSLQHGLKLPLCSLIYDCIFNGASFAAQLLSL
jgi:glycerol-3-phosphate dehydrogenase (NAD(P)+)